MFFLLLPNVFCYLDLDVLLKVVYQTKGTIFNDHNFSKRNNEKKNFKKRIDENKVLHNMQWKLC